MTMQLNSLEQYLDEFGKNMMSAREKKIEPKWNRNLQVINGKDFYPEICEGEFKKGEAEKWRSKSIINIVRPKVYNIYSMILDIILPNDELLFTLQPNDFPMMGELPQEYKDFEEKAKNLHMKAIQQQLKERKADRQYFRKLLSLLIYGMAWSKYNLEAVTYRGYRPIGGGMNEQGQQQVRWMPYQEQKQVIGHDYVPIWQMYWDMEADKIEDGHGCFQRKLIDLFELASKKGEDWYIDTAIDRVIEEWEQNQATKLDSLDPGLRAVAQRKKTIDNREHWVRVPQKLIDKFEKEELELIKKDKETDIDILMEDQETGEEGYILVETANGKIIRYKSRPNSWQPYRKCIWEENLDQTDNPAAGPPDLMEHVQYIYTGLFRAFIDNKKLSGNIREAIKRKFFQDPSQLKHMHPGIQIDISDDCTDARQAIVPLPMQDVGPGILEAIGLIYQLKDMVSMHPEILQGSTIPKHKPDTAYEISQLMENAGRYVGQGIRNIDEALIEPEIKDMYEFNMADPTFPDNAKGNFKCTPGGFINYKNRIISVQKLKELLALVLSSDFLANEAKIRAYLDEIHINLGYDPKKFLKTDEEKQEEQQRHIEMQERARAQAFQDLMVQTQIETQGKIAIEREKAKGKAQEGESQFQRDILKQLAFPGERKAT